MHNSFLDDYLLVNKIKGKFSVYFTNWFY